MSTGIYTIIVTFNGQPWIAQALETLTSSTVRGHVIVVDNRSSDETCNIVSGFPDVILLRQSENLGFGVGNNIGISYALNHGADYIFLLNQDAYVTPTVLHEMSEFMDAHPEFAIATPLHCSPDLHSVDGRTQSAYLNKFAAGYISDACLASVRPYYPIYGINAAAWFVRADAFRVSGGFDSIYFMYGEDDDLIERFNYLGQNFVLLPASRIVHLRAKGPEKRLPWTDKVWRRSDRIRAHLVVDVKKPGRSAPGKLLRLLMNGFGVSTLRVCLDHDPEEMISQWVATCRVLYRFVDISQRARDCAKPGPHYLSLGDSME